MKWLCAAVVVAFGLATPVMAQSPAGTSASRQEDSGRREDNRRGRHDRSAADLPLPSIGLPLPTIGLPHPPTGLPPVTAAPAGGRRDGRTAPPSGGRRGRRGGFPVFVPVPVLVPTGPTGVAGTSGGAEAAPIPTPVGTGRVLFDVKPASASSAQLYVDGYYVGTPDDHRLGLELPAGAHVVEVQAPGFQSDTAPLNVSEDRVIRHRVTLAEAVGSQKETAGPSPKASGGSPAPSAPSNRPYYSIPGCYLGNVPPAEVTLPPGCDPKNVVVVRP